MPVTLSYLEYSTQPEQPVLIILHGLFGSAKNWHSIAKHLETDFHIYALDLRNHGNSEWNDEIDYFLMAEDILAFMQQHAIQKAHFIGHSMGGKVAMTFALSYPDYVDKLLVLDVAPTTYTSSFLHYIHAMQSFDLTTVTRRAEVDEALKAVVSEAGVRQFLLQNLVQQNNQYHWRINLTALANSMRHLMSFPHFAENCTYSKPTLFVRGERSDYIQNTDQLLIDSIFLQSSVVTIANAGHWVHAEQPQAFIEQALQFFK